MPFQGPECRVSLSDGLNEEADRYVQQGTDDDFVFGVNDQIIHQVSKFVASSSCSELFEGIRECYLVDEETRGYQYLNWKSIEHRVFKHGQFADDINEVAVWVNLGKVLQPLIPRKEVVCQRGSRRRHGVGRE